MNIENTIFYSVNKISSSPLLDSVMPVITELGSGRFIFILSLVMLAFRRKEIRQSGFILMAGLALASNVSYILKDLVGRPRPFLVMPDANILLPGGGFSFPSSHASIAFAAAVILTGYFKRWYLFYPLAILVALSRVYLGVHFPMDVLAGACIGTISGFVILYIGNDLVGYNVSGERS
ncbi:MAG: phosphatase PAP2 family protein [Candidatus Omnitrophica bacterium]|nr:phosphatase PAP2 family protein [Candidatus Omnitrophota bacterium]